MTRGARARARSRFIAQSVALGCALAPGVPLHAQAFVSPAPETPAPGATMLAPGDAVRITVWQQPDFSGEFVVAPDNSVAHPLYRSLKLGGVPLSQLDERVREFLERYEATPHFVVEPLFRIAVGGEVRQPSVYTVRPGTTIAQSVALAGGPTEQGRRDRVVLVRYGREMVVDLTRPDTGLAPSPIRSGDEVLVPRQRHLFRELIGPAFTVLGATAAVINVVLRAHHR
jgi:polysaccharide export outer membrane protein